MRLIIVIIAIVGRAARLPRLSFYAAAGKFYAGRRATLRRRFSFSYLHAHADTILHIVSPRRRPSDRRQDDGPSTTTTATRNYVTIIIIYYDRRRRSRGQAGDRTARSGNVAPAAAAAARSETLHTRLRRRRRRAVFLFIFYTPLPAAASVLFVDVR